MKYYEDEMKAEPMRVSAFWMNEIVFRVKFILKSEPLSDIIMSTAITFSVTSAVLGPQKSSL